VAKMALIERELKRDRLVAKYAKKHAELKGIASDIKRSEEDRATPRVSATVVQSPVVLVARSSTSVWHGRKFVKWLLPGKFLASSRPAGKRQET
jgi:hypothetical protein